MEIPDIWSNFGGFAEFLDVSSGETTLSEIGTFGFSIVLPISLWLEICDNSLQEIHITSQCIKFWCIIKIKISLNYIRIKVL